MTSLITSTVPLLLAISIISLLDVASIAANSPTTQVVGKNCTNATAVCTAASHTVCDLKTLRCKCSLGYKGTTNCSAVIGIGCTNDNDCSTVLPHSICEAKKCKCSTGYFGSTGEACLGVVGGKTCNNETDCTVLLPHTICGAGKKCVCASGFIGAMCSDISSAAAMLASIKALLVIFTVYCVVF